MAYRPEKRYPPYAGTEPYLHLCFSDADAKRVRPLLHRLYLRGVRVWYACSDETDRTARRLREERMLGAAVTVLFLTDAFRRDRRAKGDMLVCQNAGRPILCLNTDGGDGGLSIGLHPSTPEAAFSRQSRAADWEAAILRADGFTQSLIGEPQKPPVDVLRIVAWSMTALALLLALAGVWWWTQRKPTPPPEPVDTVAFADETVREAVRAALGGGVLTEERLLEVTTLSFPDALPEDVSDLSRLPSLTRIELTQSAALSLDAHPELTAYTLVLIGGAE